MTSLKDRIVLITGASSGIGAACAHAFAQLGSRLIISARRKERIEALVREIKEKHKTDVLGVQLDVQKQPDVESAFSTLPKEWQEIEVLVNNAGLSRGLDKLHEGKIADWEEMIDTNIKGLLYVSRAVIPGMVARGHGTVINIGSIAGQEVYPGGNVYCATKHAVDAITRGLRFDLVDSPVRVCTVDPGLVQTEFSIVRFRGDSERAESVYKKIQALKPEDVAEAVVFCATRPPHVQLAQVLILPTAQASTTLVHRKP
ncbi:MAG: SDR family NAD(P)-dependent oxidoreductase [Ignavibacteria bacterium]|nr:SDR family NAD(P)-dependent oxidoreductase [Ignavibacteria bacterium]